MNILIELPTWLGDTIMTTPSIDEIVKLYPDAKISFFGSFVSTQAMSEHPHGKRVKVDESKKAKSRLLWLYITSKKLGKFDLVISFRSSIFSSVFLWFLNAKKKLQYKKNVYSGHQVEKYSKFISNSLQLELIPANLKLYQKSYMYKKPTLGINPGATYGSAKRWYPQEFANVAIHFAKDYDIVIFGGPHEKEIAQEIKSILYSNGIRNLRNLAGKTTIPQLIQKIAGLSLFITNDSGPMHIAAAYKIPTVAIFGPTRHEETSGWKNPNGYIISHDLKCAPCMKRVCPLKTHECMKGIKADEVIRVLKNHLSLGK